MELEQNDVQNKKQDKGQQSKVWQKIKTASCFTGRSIVVASKTASPYIWNTVCIAVGIIVAAGYLGASVEHRK